MANSISFSSATAKHKTTSIESSKASGTPALRKRATEEAQVLAQKLKDQPIDALYHSPLTRIVQTIQPILSDHPNIPVHADPDLKGQSLGKLEGGSYDTIDMSNPRSADGQPGVELFDDFVRRLKRAFARIVGAEAPKASWAGAGSHGRDRHAWRGYHFAV